MVLTHKKASQSIALLPKQNAPFKKDNDMSPKPWSNDNGTLESKESVKESPKKIERFYNILPVPVNVPVPPKPVPSMLKRKNNKHSSLDTSIREVKEPTGVKRSMHDVVKIY